MKLVKSHRNLLHWKPIFSFKVMRIFAETLFKVKLVWLKKKVKERCTLVYYLKIEGDISSHFYYDTKASKNILFKNTTSFIKVKGIDIVVKYLRNEFHRIQVPISKTPTKINLLSIDLESLSFF